MSALVLVLALLEGTLGAEDECDQSRDSPHRAVKQEEGKRNPRTLVRRFCTCHRQTFSVN